MKRFPVISFLTVLTLVGGSARADFLTGRIVDSNGVGVPGVDIDADNIGSGGDPDIFNDGTDANGFFTTTIPNGVYRMIFQPPTPPTTTLLTLEVEPVVIVGTHNIGTLVLPDGIRVTGHCIRTNGNPVAGINLDVVDSNGVKLITPGDTTDAFGNFSIAAPNNGFELRMNTAGVLGAPLAPASFDFGPAGVVNMGNVTMQPGLAITGTARRQNGTGLANADIDVIDSNGVKIYTPGDNTAANGTFSVVVAAGVYDVEICPPVGVLAVGALAENVNVVGNTNIGVLTLVNGVTVSGTITAAGMGGIAGVNIDVDDALGSSVPICNDSTTATGTYAIVVPTGTNTISFKPPFTLPLGTGSTTQVIGGSTTLNMVLPACPFATNYGTGSVGSGGFVPSISSIGGAPRAGNQSWGYRVTNGLGGAIGSVIISKQQATVNLPFGQLLVNPANSQAVRFPIFLGGAFAVPGAGERSTLLPAPISVLVGSTFFFQAGFLDNGSPGGISLTQGMSTTFCP